MSFAHGGKGYYPNLRWLKGGYPLPPPPPLNTNGGRKSCCLLVVTSLRLNVRFMQSILTPGVHRVLVHGSSEHAAQRKGTQVFVENR